MTNLIAQAVVPPPPSYRRKKYTVSRHAVEQPHDQSIRLIALTRGKVAVVDAVDYESLMRWNWSATKGRSTWYAVRMDGDTMISMHRQIMGLPVGVMCDHRDHDGLNNRRTNLRPATNQQNIRNGNAHRDSTSQYRGVSWVEANQKWTARIRADGANYYLGLFSSEVEAARAYDAKAAECFGPFANLNFPKEKAC